MKIVLDQRRVRWTFRGGVAETLQRVLVNSADAIGFCVGEIRIHIFPRVQQVWQYVLSQPDDEIRQEPSFVVVSRQLQEQQGIGCEVSGEELLAREKMLRGQLSDKKYTYGWAVERIAELETIGVSDPVTYFNNEMTDWWLAPDGMMEEDADFLGIAYAIEERWHV